MLQDTYNDDDQRRNGRVLVVDDNANFRTVMRMMLTKGGYAVVEAEDGAQALEILRTSRDSTDADIIICPIRLPHMNGGEPVLTLRQEFPSIPVVVLTGFPDIMVATSFFEEAIIEYRPTPIARDKLLAVVANAMEQRIALKNLPAIAARDA